MSGIIAQNSGRHTGLVKASSGGGGVWNLIETLTSDGSDSDLSFTSGIDSTYDEYVFKFINIHPETDNTSFGFQVNASGESDYNETITSTFFNAQHNESDANTYLMYRTTGDQAEGTSLQKLTEGTGADNDQSVSGTLHLYNPSDTTFVKHFIATNNHAHNGDYTMNNFIAGYVNITAAITEVQFKFEADEIQGGSISLYGIT